MTGETDLLAAVARDPWADAPRLALADWWEETAPDAADPRATRARAEFVRLQIAVTRSRNERVRRRLGRKAEGVLLGNAVTFRGWPDVVDLLDGWGLWLSCDHGKYAVTGTGRGRVSYARGFPATLTLPLAAFVADPARVGRITGLTGVVISDATIFPSGGNDTYYVGNLGAFPREYWRRLGNLPSRSAALAALSAAALSLARSATGLDPA
jgi:uncharacterized protein (TIGR02996 family)